MGRFLWGVLALTLTANAWATVRLQDAHTQVVARDIRKLGNGLCVASVTVRYAEASQPMSVAQRLLRSSRQTVACTKADETADLLTRQLEVELLVQAQIQVNDDNTRVRSFALKPGTQLRAEATSLAPVVRRLPAGGGLQARSVTPSWYAVTDAIGTPIGGYFHASTIAMEVGKPQPGLSQVAAACNARLRSAPSSKGRVVQSLSCGQALSVIMQGQNGWYEVVSASGAPQGRYINGKVVRPVTQVQ
jgi:hypothetical protein